MEGVSVVIHTYNRASLITQSIEAVLGQTAAPREIIVVDDGSTDETLQVLDRYRDRIEVLTIPNGGEFVARNNGSRAARADLVAFCDSDDLWRPEFLEAGMALHRAEPRLTATYSDFSIIKEDGDTLFPSKFAMAPPGYSEV